MMCSDHPRPQVSDIIRKIQSSLDEARIQAVIDDPIDEALAAVSTHEPPSSAHELIAHVASAIRNLFGRLPIAARCFDEARARDEAAFLIAECYGGLPGAGFESAMLEATDDRIPGLDLLYRRLWEHLKARLRQDYVNGVFSRHLDPSDWDTNRAVAAVFLDKLRPDLPEGAPTLRPEQFVDCIPELFFAAHRAEYPTMPLFVDRFPTTT